MEKRVAFVLTSWGITPEGGILQAAGGGFGTILAELQEHMRGLRIPHCVTVPYAGSVSLRVDAWFQANPAILGKVIVVCPTCYQEQAMKGLDSGYPTALWVFDGQVRLDETSDGRRYFGNVFDRGLTRIIAAALKELREMREPFIPQLQKMASR